MIVPTRSCSTRLVAALAGLVTLAGLATLPGVRPPAAEAHAMTAGGSPGAPVSDDLLPAPTPGEEAVGRLDAGELADAADRNDVSPSGLTRTLRHDDTAWLGRDGQLFYVEETPAAAGSTGQAGQPVGTPAPLSQTFALHSMPGAQRTIFLDVDGARVTDSWTNRQYSLPGTTEPAWDPAGDGPAFSDAERVRVQQIWARVAEDYAPFAVDVTTEQPPAGALSRSGATDPTYGVRVLIGPSPDVWSTVCEQTCGGIAPLGSFDEYGAGTDAYRDAWVFTDGLHDDAKYVAEAAAHEAGHTLGLRHDGVVVTSTSGGAPTTRTLDYSVGGLLWGPLMGAPYDSAVTQWSKGEYPGADNAEDDLALISRASMLPLRTDEAGPTVAGAPPRPQGTAYLTSSSDTDVFDLGTCSGPVTLSAAPAALGPDLDVSLALLDPAGRVLALAEPTTRATTTRPVTATDMGATISTSIGDSGHLYARVRGSANGTWADGGYGTYGSIGAYRLSVTGCVDTPGPPGAPGSPSASADALARTLSVHWQPPASNGGSPVTAYQVALDGGAPATVTGTSAELRDVATGAHRVSISATTALGTGPAATVDVTMPAPPTVPGAVSSLRASADRARGTVTLTWDPPAHDGGLGVTGYRVHQYDAAGRDLGARAVDAGLRRATLGPVPAGRVVRYGVTALNQLGEGPATRGSLTMPAPAPVATVPAAPSITRVAPGRRGAPFTVALRWSAPRSTGGAPVTAYRLVLARVDRAGRVVRTTRVALGLRTRATVRLSRGGRYRLAVQAANRVGWGSLSPRTRAVRGR